MNRDKQQIETVQRYPLVFRTLQVLKTRHITPRIKRITLTGDELVGFKTASPDDHVKLFFPHHKKEKPVLPQVENGRVIRPSDGSTSPARDYTPRYYHEDKNQLDIDFVLHGSGVGSPWASNAEPGDYIGLGGPRGSRIIAPVFDWYLLVGDESALPALLRRLEELPLGTIAHAYISVENDDEIQPVETQAQVNFNWLTRQRENNIHHLLLDSIKELSFPEGNGFFWVAGEVETVRVVKRYLSDNPGNANNLIKANGYWKKDVINYDHHEPIE